MNFAMPAPFNPPERVSYRACEVATDVRDEILDLVESAVREDPPRPARLAPSSLGHECEWCLAHYIARCTKVVQDPSWYAFTGKSGHSGLEQVFRRAGWPWGTEVRKLVCGTYTLNGETLEVRGTVDLVRFDPIKLTVVDHKFVGKKSLTRVRKGEYSQVNKVQLHTYGAGFSRLGYKVENVAFMHYPLEAYDIRRSAIWYAEPYDMQIVIEYMVRAQRIADLITEHGLIEALLQLPQASGCYDCKRWETPA